MKSSEGDFGLFFENARKLIQSTPRESTEQRAINVWALKKLNATDGAESSSSGGSSSDSPSSSSGSSDGT